MKARIVLLLGILILSGCHTPYVPPAAQGEYSVQKMGLNSFLIVYQGDGSASDERVVDFALLRACHVAEQNGYRYFALVDLEKSTPERTVFGHGPRAEDAREGLVIHGFRSRPMGIFFFRGSSLEKVLWEKYEPGAG